MREREEKSDKWHIEFNRILSYLFGFFFFSISKYKDTASTKSNFNSRSERKKNNKQLKLERKESKRDSDSCLNNNKINGRLMIYQDKYEHRSKQHPSLKTHESHKNRRRKYLSVWHKHNMLFIHLLVWKKKWFVKDLLFFPRLLLHHFRRCERIEEKMIPGFTEYTLLVDRFTIRYLVLLNFSFSCPHNSRVLNIYLTIDDVYFWVVAASSTNNLQ